MNGQHLAELEGQGLSPSEARVYTLLLTSGPIGAQAVADGASLNRSTTYQVLKGLAEKGLVEGGVGYGSRYRAVPPEQALPGLIDRQREGLTSELAERERRAKELIGDLVHLSAPADAEVAVDEVVEIIGNPRAVGERFVRLQLEADHEIRMFTKAPIVVQKGNPAERTALERGVAVKCLYEAAVLEDESIGPYVSEWVEAGEVARVYPGELPFKFVMFDGATVLMPLETPGTRHAMTSILIRHPALARGLAMLFDCLWDLSDPVGLDGRETR